MVTGQVVGEKTVKLVARLSEVAVQATLGRAGVTKESHENLQEMKVAGSNKRAHQVTLQDHKVEF